jgi:hypothetical protein
VINKGAKKRIVRIQLPRALGRGTLERLVARTLASTSGVTFGGRSLERGGFDGRLHGSAHRTRVKPLGRSYSFAMPGASAALLTAR